MITVIKAFVLDEQAQDLTEYALLLACMVLVCAALLLELTPGLNGIWTTTSTTASTGNTVFSS